MITSLQSTLGNKISNVNGRPGERQVLVLQTLLASWAKLSDGLRDMKPWQSGLSSIWSSFENGHWLLGT